MPDAHTNLFAKNSLVMTVSALAEKILWSLSLFIFLNKWTHKLFVYFSFICFNFKRVLGFVLNLFSSCLYVSDLSIEGAVYTNSMVLHTASFLSSSYFFFCLSFFSLHSTSYIIHLFPLWVSLSSSFLYFCPTDF